MNRYDDIVDMAESGDLEAYVGPAPTRQVWRRQWTDPSGDQLADWERRWFAERGGIPKPMEVLVPPRGGECYPVHDLLTDQVMREAVKRTADMRRRTNRATKPVSYILLMEGTLRGGDGENVAHLWATSRRDRCGMHTQTKCGLSFHNLFDDLDEYVRLDHTAKREVCEACLAR